MPLWHHDLNKKKTTGGKRKQYRTKRAFEAGGFASEANLGVPLRKQRSARGGVSKTKVISGQYVNVTDSTNNVTKRAEILRVIHNPVNADYDRRKIMTKGTMIETSVGEAVITSRLGQDGIINAVLVN